MARLAVRLPAPFVFRVRSRTVAKVDSIALVVRRWIQCSAGKSKWASRTSRSLTPCPQPSGTWRRSSLKLIDHQVGRFLVLGIHDRVQRRVHLWLQA
jgi:hypothetical protein